MSFIKRDVKDRVVQYPRRYQLVEVQPGIFDLIPVTGTVTEEGTAINKAYLQPLEDGLADALEKTGDGKDVIVTFTEAATEAHIASGEKLSTLFGKILKKFKNVAPTSHASSANTYGVGTTANFGHCKTINNLTQASHVNGNALSAYQGKVLKDSIDLCAPKPVLIRSISMPATLKGFSVQITDNLDAYDEIILELTGTCTIQNTSENTSALGKFGFEDSLSGDVNMHVIRINLNKSKSVSATIQAIRRHRLVLGAIDGSTVYRSMVDGNMGSTGEAVKYTDLYLVWNVSGAGATLNITSGSLTAKIYGLKVVRL